MTANNRTRQQAEQNMEAKGTTAGQHSDSIAETGLEHRTRKVDPATRKEAQKKMKEKGTTIGNYADSDTGSDTGWE